MFDYIIKLWKQDTQLKQAMEETREMFHEDRRMLVAAIDEVFDGAQADVDIFLEDKKVNRLEMSIRTKILKHLAVNPSPDVNAALIVIGVVREIERIGDYCKNIHELYDIGGGELSDNKYKDILRDYSKNVIKMLDMTMSSYENSDKKTAKQVMDMHHQKHKIELDKLIKEISDDENLSSRAATRNALLARYLKRVSAHLANIASSVTNPFAKVSFDASKYKNGG